MNEPTPTDLARWERWDDLRKRKAKATTDEERAALAREEEELSQQGIRELLVQDVQNEPSWMWLSFVDTESGEFLGVTIIKAGGVMEATILARAKGCNPGGEVAAYPIDPEDLPPREYRERLLTKEEALSVQASRS